LNINSIIKPPWNRRLSSGGLVVQECGDISLVTCAIAQLIWEWKSRSGNMGTWDIGTRTTGGRHDMVANTKKLLSARYSDFECRLNVCLSLIVIVRAYLSVTVTSPMAEAVFVPSDLQTSSLRPHVSRQPHDILIP
jgi:hypothetical protein